jgi:zinc protease
VKRATFVLSSLFALNAFAADAPKDPWEGRADLWKPPAIKPSTKVSLGQVERFTLPNGLKVVVVPRKSVPSVDITLALRVGEGANPIDKSGVAQFTAMMLRKGTERRTADQISEAIDFVGGSLEANTSEDATLVGCHARARDLPLCLDLVSDVTQRPTFPEGEMSEVRDQLTADVEGVKDNPQGLASQHLANLFFGDETPRGRPMSKRSIGAITREDLVKMHQTWFAPNTGLLAISGDVDAKMLRADLTKYFGAWKKKTTPQALDRPLPKPGKLALRLVDKPDATQATLVLAGPGIKHASPDLYAVRIMNWALGGGGFSSRLMKVVRSEGGKTYGARSGFEARRLPGPWSASTFTRTSETASTLKLVMDEIAKMKDGGPAADEIAAAKGNLIGGYGLKLETGEDIARAISTAEFDGLDAKFVEQYPARLDKVTIADATRVAKQYLTPTALVVVGKAEEVKPMLEKAGLELAGPIEVVSYLDPVSAAERKAMAGEKTAAATMTPEEADAGRKLLEAALLAKGGKALAAIKSLALRGKGTVSMQGQQMPVTVDEWQVPGTGSRQDLGVGAMKVTQVYAGGRGWVRQGEKKMDMPPQIAAQMQKGIWRDPNFILQNAAQPGAKVRALGPQKDGQASFDGLAVIAPSGDITKLWLDPKTHLIARMIYADDGKESRDDLSDYKSEAGVAFPRKILHDGGGQKLEVAYEKIEVNAKLPDDLFKP